MSLPIDYSLKYLNKGRGLVVVGPVWKMHAGLVIKATLKDGRSCLLRIKSLGKPYKDANKWKVYGYINEQANSYDAGVANVDAMADNKDANEGAELLDKVMWCLYSKDAPEPSEGTLGHVLAGASRYALAAALVEAASWLDPDPDPGSAEDVPPWMDPDF